ncbi:MAG: arsenosugar biosynthesis radical SAM (seleno)protein ArsS [Coriobacteriales bacterium]|jgi:arsenite methyltransferase
MVDAEGEILEGGGTVFGSEGNRESIHELVRQYYESLNSSDDLQTNACCCSTQAPPSYVLDVMRLLPDEVVEKFYGCGSPIPPALDGCTVLDLGCGTGRDVYVVSKLVGPAGKVIGVDMTPAQLEVARKYVDTQTEAYGYDAPNVEFRQGYIEDLKSLGIEDESIDLVISNCVINLSPFKDQVFSEIWRVLKPGGELYFSDVFCDRRLPQKLREDPVLRGECLGGAMYISDFKTTMARHGWTSYLETAVEDIEISNLELETRVGFCEFTSRTIRAIKAVGLEPFEENCGQQATLKGGMPQMPRYFDLDSNIRLIKGRPHAISSNMAKMISQSRYGKYIDVTPEGTHMGEFKLPDAQDAIDFSKGKREVDLDYICGVQRRCGIEDFDKRVGDPGMLVSNENPTTLQVNITYGCNLACSHCFLKCGPNSSESMSRPTMEACLAAIPRCGFEILDITGGSPELHPDFEWFVREGSKLAHTIVRTNLTLLLEPEYRHLIEVFAECGVQLVASLPYFSSQNTDGQRGRGVFGKSIEAIHLLNDAGYGKGGDLELDLAYNVSGPFLAPPQDLLEDLYRKQLLENEGIEFDGLFAMSNFPLGRFGEQLVRTNTMDPYMKLLANNFNAMAAGRLMCRSQVNVDYDGRVYDCECNHVLNLPVQLEGQDVTIEEMTSENCGCRKIRTSPVCYTCSAGAGSSCGGSLI